ncbi:U-scoloptoxin(01)-Cw1a-like isoform X1 [Euwallacea fornicatus]|uniref:U-scoloptoxin(01)-Cw1a-like isoform X1 n=2 Tax=Euwallacea fornicatus TaxID=995702 RepID=UPI00338E2B2C
MNSVFVLLVLFCAVWAYPSVRIMPEHLPSPQLLTLPSNATSIRTDISDSFSCDGRDYGYYADVENECQLFHVCLPIKYQDGRSQMFRWSFICPEETVFNQEIFTCTRADESIDCAESPRFYDLNRYLGSAEVDQSPTEISTGLEEDAPVVPAEVMQSLARTSPHKKGRIE